MLEDGWSASRFPPLSLFLSPGILIIPPVSPPHRVGGFFPSDKVSRSFYKLIRVCSLWSRQLWTRRIDLAGESAVPDHDFKQNPMFLWRGRPSPEQYPYYPSIWLVQSEGGWWWWWGGEVGQAGSTCAWWRRLRRLRWDFDHSDSKVSSCVWNQVWILDVIEMLN